MDSMNNTLRMDSASQLILSHKERRKLRKPLKSAGKEFPKCNGCGTDISSTLAVVSIIEPVYCKSCIDEGLCECCLCLDDHPVDQGVLACWAHFICTTCVKESFERAIYNMDEFPFKCCAGQGLSPAIVLPLLNEDVARKYRDKLEECYTPSKQRVYCSDPNCATFIPPRDFTSAGHTATVAVCSQPQCRAITCANCKQPYIGDHSCPPETERMAKPNWLPEYSAQCRMKQCPFCNTWVEHREACNHMECSICHHQWCFICLSIWGDCANDGVCPTYGDPSYDKHGFEVGERKLHRDTGRNPEGLTRAEIAARKREIVHEPNDDLTENREATWEAENGGIDRPPWVPAEINIDPWRVAHEDWSDDEVWTEDEDEEWFINIDPAMLATISGNETEVLPVQNYLNIPLLDNETSEWGIGLLFESAEASYDDKEYFQNEDFGMKSMFEAADNAALEEFPTVVVDGMSDSGRFGLSFPTHRNPYSVLDE